jgi:hypothetical protein
MASQFTKSQKHLQITATIAGQGKNIAGNYFACTGGHGVAGTRARTAAASGSALA